MSTRRCAYARCIAAWLLLLDDRAAVHSFHISPTRSYAARPAIHRIRIRMQPRAMAKGDEGSGNDEPAYDITQNLFPETGGSPKNSPSPFQRREQSEMNSRGPPSESSNRDWERRDEDVERKNAGNKERASALYQKIKSKRRKTKEEESKGSQPASASSAAPAPAPASESFYDITQSLFPERRSSFKSGERSEMNTRNAPSANRGPKWSRPTSGRSTSSSSSDEGSHLDITSQFPGERPTMLVNTGTKKDRTTTGSYAESKRRRSDDKSPNAKGGDDSFVDITKHHFGTDRRSFVSMVNTGTLDRRGTTAGQSTAASYEEGCKNVARNFSPDRASLLGHSSRRIDMTTFRGDRSGSVGSSRNGADMTTFRGDGGGSVGSSRSGAGVSYLDTHNFSSKLSRGSTPAGRGTNALWRESREECDPEDDGSCDPEEEKYLDTPHAFQKDLDMVPSKITKGKNQADKFLDNNAFSWNVSSQASTSNRNARELSSSSSTKRPISREQQEQRQYLDKPRAFQQVDMVSSNFSGVKHKRSSDVPPEEKNIRDVYDRASSSSSGSSSSRSGSGGGDREDVFDITRASFSKLERTSSAVKDANNAAKATSRDEAPAKDGAATEEEDEQSSYEEVMSWLLTNLPNLHEEDAISYFHHLLEDGFDNVDMLRDLMEDDLSFMKRGHRRALMRSFSSEEEGNDALEEEEVGNEDDDALDSPTETEVDDDQTLEALDDAIGKTRADLEEIEAQIEEQNRLMEETVAGGSSTVEEAEEEEERGPERADTSPQDDQYEDITRSSFVDRPSLSDSVHTVLPNSAARRDKNRVPADDDGLDEEVFDITRDAFPDRPSLSAANSNSHFESPSSRKRRKINTASVSIENRPSPRSSGSVSAVEDALPPQEVTPPPRKIAPETNTADVPELAPRAELHQYYTKKGFTNEQAQRLKDFFTTWTNDAKSHELKFTCIFTCPVTEEHFACGDWRRDGINAEGSNDEQEQVYWYKTKKHAMNAAAAKALDCFAVRENDGTQIRALQRCEDAPYRSKEEAPSLPTLPNGVSLPKEIIQPAGT